MAYVQSLLKVKFVGLSHRRVCGPLRAKFAGVGGSAWKLESERE